MMKKCLWALLLGAFSFFIRVNSVLAVTACQNNTGIETAIGCVPMEMSGFVSWLLTWLFGLAGGIAFVLMVFGFVMLGTSSGDEKKVAGAKETITSAVVGLLVSISALFILRLIVVDILKIPGI